MERIAIPFTKDHKIDEHFGHCEFYGIYTITDQEVQDVRVLESKEGCGCKSNIAEELADCEVTTMLAGGIGAGAINVLSNHGIRVIRGCSGSVEDVIQDYITGIITDSGKSCDRHNPNHDCDNH